MQAQSVAAEQMNECFNDSTKLPYGWFAEGWTLKDGAIQTGISSSEGAEGDDESGISSLLNSLMGGDSEPNYLLTPPLMVNEGETLVFSAKKGKSNNSGTGGISFGSSDSTFVVERSVYSRNQWVRVADFTVDLDTIYKTFTIANTPAGEYRFRFKAGGTVLIDSVAGFIYGLRDDGSWARFRPGIDEEQHSLAAFRGYFEANASPDSIAAARMSAAALPGTYKTMFQMSDQQGTSTGEKSNYDNLGYEGNIPFNQDATSVIQPTIRAIDADGTSRYFDLQGRMLNGTPVKGVYINNGKKVIR